MCSIWSESNSEVASLHWDSYCAFAARLLNYSLAVLACQCGTLICSVLRPLITGASTDLCSSTSTHYRLLRSCGDLALPPGTALCLPTTCWPGCLSTALSKSASDLESARGMSDNDSQLLVLPMLLLSMECKDNFNFNNNTLPPRGVAGRAFIVAISVHLCRAGNLLIMHKWSTGWGRAVQKAIKWRQQALLGADFCWVNTVQL